MTKRICHLQIGEKFIYMGSPKEVTDILMGFVCYEYLWTNGSKRTGKIGANSQQIVEVI